MIVRLLEACDAGCFMCEFAHSEEPYRFTGAEARKLADSLQGGSVRLIRFTGGEPLLHEEIVEIIAAFARHGILTSVITNGGLLEERRREITGAGISQVVVSLDSPDPASHDRFRQTQGLFDRAVAGITALRRESPQVRTRVNTVAGPHNVGQLPEMYDLLARIGVDDWSIIPLKSADGLWQYPKPAAALAAQRQFQAHVANRPGPRLLGFSRDWMGRSEEEEQAYLEGGRPMTPRGACGVVDTVRYYTPKSGTYYGCNCVPHRSGGVDLGIEWKLDGGEPMAGGEPLDWLREHGPSTCTGCEPANAALGEGALDLDSDPFAF